MLKLSKKKVDIFLGNHMQHNNTEEKAQMKKCGNKYAFVDTDEWQRYNLWCIENLSNMIKKEKTK